jgi:hypothetical protein
MVAAQQFVMTESLRANFASGQPARQLQQVGQHLDPMTSAVLFNAIVLIAAHAHIRWATALKRFKNSTFG